MDSANSGRKCAKGGKGELKIDNDYDNDYDDDNGYDDDDDYDDGYGENTLCKRPSITPNQKRRHNMTSLQTLLKFNYKL